MTYSRRRLKTHLSFQCSFPDFCSACELTCVIVRHLTVFVAHLRLTLIGLTVSRTRVFREFLSHIVTSKHVSSFFINVWHTQSIHMKKTISNNYTAQLMSLNSSLYKKFFLNMLLTIRGIVKLWERSRRLWLLTFSAGISTVGGGHGLGYAIWNWIDWFQEHQRGMRNQGNWEAGNHSAGLF